MVYGLYALSRSPGFLATVAGGIASANLISASLDQDHTISPSASAPLVNGTSASITSRPTSRDDREAPLLWGGMTKHIVLIWGSEKQKYFCKGGWTTAKSAGALICPSGQIKTWIHLGKNGRAGYAVARG